MRRGAYVPWSVSGAFVSRAHEDLKGAHFSCLLIQVLGKALYRTEPVVHDDIAWLEVLPLSP